MSNLINIIQSTNEEVNYIKKKLIEFNSKNIPNGTYEEVNLCVKNDEGRIVAGLNSAIRWNWMDIDIVWVDEEFRKQGYGKMLLQEAERIARSKACSFIKLYTFSFQAPEYYKKYGYEVIAIFENAPKGNNTYYYKKDLN